MQAGDLWLSRGNENFVTGKVGRFFSYISRKLGNLTASVIICTVATWMFLDFRFDVTSNDALIFEDVSKNKSAKKIFVKRTTSLNNAYFLEV